MSLAVLALSATADAHVGVTAPAATAGSLTTFTVTIPNERSDAATVKVSVRVPSAFERVTALPTDGWTVATSADGDDTVLTWSGGRIAGTDRVTHRFRAAGPSAGTYSVPAVQTYDDGQVVRWIGGEGDEYPAPVVTIGAGGQAVQTTPTHEIPAETTTDGTTTTAADTGGGNTGWYVLGGAVIVLAGAGTWALTRRRRTD